MIYKTQWQAQRREQPERAPIKAILWNGNRFKSRGKRSIQQVGQYVSVRQLITRHSLFNSSLIMLEIPRLITHATAARPPAGPAFPYGGERAFHVFLWLLLLLLTSIHIPCSQQAPCRPYLLASTARLFLLRSQKYLKCFDYVCLARHGKKSKCYLCTRLIYEKTRGSGGEIREGTQIPSTPTIILLPHHFSRPAPAPFPPLS